MSKHISDEPILKENKDRFVLFPIRQHDIWKYYKQAEASFWTAEEIDLGQDMKDWVSLNDGERHFISHVLAFFAFCLRVFFIKSEFSLASFRYLFKGYF